jgi:hypothetical protein
VSAIGAAEPRRAERHWVRIGLAVVGVLLVAQFVGGVVRTAVSPGRSPLERVQTCLTERSTPFETVGDDPLAQSAGHGALRTTVEGNRLTIALGSSERDARRVYEDYTGVMSPAAASALLDLHRRVVFLWENAPTRTQTDFAYLCTLDVQD